MKSVKPGRGPSMMGGIVGIAVAIFGVLWTIGAVQITGEMDPFMQDAAMGGPGVIFPLFGVVFVIVAVVGVIYNFRNATGKRRYSEFDIVDGDEEPDPLNQRFGGAEGEIAYCPNCGRKLVEPGNFCPGCGEKLR